MKKSLIFKILYSFLVLVAIVGASVFATNTYLASQVSYGSTNVADALNDLYKTKSNNNIYTFDTSNLIYTICEEPDWVSDTSFSYTATQDCYILGLIAGLNYGNVSIKVNDVTIGFFQGYTSTNIPINYLIKSGDKIEFIGTGKTVKRIYVYGIK